MSDRIFHDFVDGEYVDSVDGRTVSLIDPSTGEVFADAPLSGEADVDRAMRAAAHAFEGWRDTTPSERSLALLRIADAVERRAAALVAAESQNTGKPLGLTRSEELGPMVDPVGPRLGDGVEGQRRDVTGHDTTAYPGSRLSIVG